MSVEMIAAILIGGLLLAKAVLMFLVLDSVIEDGYRREMRAHGLDPGPLPRWITWKTKKTGLRS